MDADCHGNSGVSQLIKGHLWTTFVVPRLLYGLETVILNNSDRSVLEIFKLKH